jgi:RHS repeat-associated protein
MQKKNALRLLLASTLTVTLSAGMAQTQNTTTSYEYDPAGNLKKITAPLNRVTDLDYDPLNRLQTTTQPVPATGVARPIIQYGYDGQDQLTSVIDPRSKTTGYTINGLGNQSQLTSPDTGITTNTVFDESGNLKSSTDARGKTTSYTYDVLNRLTNINYASGTPTVFEYDGGSSGAAHAKGQLTKITDESGQTVYQYGPFNRLMGKQQTVTLAGVGSIVSTVVYGYGTSGYETGKLNTIIYPSGSTVVYTYDSAGRINNVGLYPANNGTPQYLLMNIGYTPFGLPNSWTWGNSTPTNQNTYARGFDLDGRINSYPLGNPLTGGFNRTVLYDAANRITDFQHTGSNSAVYNQSFSYDGLDRLTGSQAPGMTLSTGMQYDANGNRTVFTVNGANYSQTIKPNNNQLGNSAGPGPVKSNTFDAAGNLTSDGTYTYTYSYRGRMSKASLGGSSVNYLYNGLNQRVLKYGPASVVATTGYNAYVYDEAGHLLGEYEADGTPIQETVYLGDLPIAVLKTKVTGTAPNLTTTTEVYYIYADHINTPRVITRATDNQAVWRWDTTDAFGILPPNENPANLGTFTYNSRFPGQFYDKETNLFYNNARYYDPMVGRYITSDPIGIQGGINTYTYALNQPVRYADPSGLQVCVMMLTPTGPVPVCGPAPIPRPDSTDSSPAIPPSVSWPKLPIFSWPGLSLRLMLELCMPSEKSPDTLQPGPHAGDSIPARGPGRDFTQGERDAINEIGDDTGCHTCGTDDPGTKSGNWVLDHQPSSGLNTDNRPQRLYPHCLKCSRTQGGQVRGAKSK